MLTSGNLKTITNYYQKVFGEKKKEPEGIGENRNVAGGFGLKTRRRNKSGLESMVIIIVNNCGDGGGGRFNHERIELRDSGGAKP